MSDIFDLISKLELSDDYEISSMAMKMRVKIGKYWAEDMELNPRMNMILYIAAVLDPRQKMNHVETCFKSIERLGILLNIEEMMMMRVIMKGDLIVEDCVVS
ncbi:hypothetical protein AAHA92_17273 [Salvia divinorum]|uniref:hAT-like transposase RNase-H fold domain-containing protein n=1 Tax=Salvia divinorum TaxID=28513 RepID=A0ABD1GYS2_SALDI